MAQRVYPPWLLYSPFTVGLRHWCRLRWRFDREMTIRAVPSVEQDAWWCLSNAGLVWC